jgi:hypothetical protein
METEAKKFYMNMMETAALKQQVKEQIIEFLNLKTIKPSDIKMMNPYLATDSALIQLIQLN